MHRAGALRFSLHGVILELTGRDAHGLGATLMDTFPTFEGAGSPDISFDFLEAGEAARLTSRFEASRATFHFDEFRGYSQGEDLILSDGVCHVQVRPAEGRVEVAVPAHGPLSPYGFVTGPLTVALLMALRRHGLFHLHAGGVVLADEIGALVSAPSGGGKTTLVLALASCGAQVVGDDAVLLQEAVQGVRALGLPRPFHLAEATLEAFPTLSAQVGVPYREGITKRPLHLEQAFPGRMRPSLRPGLLVFPEVRSQIHSVMEAVPASFALPNLLGASALMLLPGALRTKEHMALLGKLVSSVPAFRLYLGRDLLEAPAETATRLLDAMRKELPRGT